MLIFSPRSTASSWFVQCFGNLLRIWCQGALRIVADQLIELRARLAAAAPQSVDDVRAAGRSLVGFSPVMAATSKQLKGFLRSRMYSHPLVSALRDPSQLVVTRLFAAYHADTALLPAEWAAAAPLAEPARARHIADFMAGMTDRYALRCYEEIIGASPLPTHIKI